MAIVALGLDLTRISRMADMLERRGQRAKDRLFSPAEQAYCERRVTSAQSYAGRFAVKESVMKMLGTGWARGVRWVDIETLRDPGQAPRVVLHGVAAERAAALGIARTLCSITHDADVAAAFVVGESA